MAKFKPKDELVGCLFILRGKKKENLVTQDPLRIHSVCRRLTSRGFASGFEHFENHCLKGTKHECLRRPPLEPGERLFCEGCACGSPGHRHHDRRHGSWEATTSWVKGHISESGLWLCQLPEGDCLPPCALVPASVKGADPIWAPQGYCDETKLRAQQSPCTE